MTQLVTNKFQAKSLKNRIEYSRYWQHSTRNKEKFMSIHNENMQLLFLCEELIPHPILLKIFTAKWNVSSRISAACATMCWSFFKQCFRFLTMKRIEKSLLWCNTRWWCSFLLLFLVLANFGNTTQNTRLIRSDVGSKLTVTNDLLAGATFYCFLPSPGHSLPPYRFWSALLGTVERVESTVICY